ncbi:MAG: UDP-glucuronic acid decarboxylase family protein [Actinomycetota bacterium]
MRILVAGGAGFLGSHLCERLVADGHQVVCYDNLLTGNLENLSALRQHDHFEFREQNIINEIELEGDVDWVMNFASPASPRDYLEHPIHTLKVGAVGTMNCLGLAKAKDAGFFLASTSEVYGDPLVHPQPETYWGNVNPTGPRAVYDEAKRFAEAMTYAYHRTWSVPVRVVRIFNTFGPRMRQADGRAVPTFISQAVEGAPLTVHGDGSQTRSLCFVTDLIEGIVRLLESEVAEPVNIGNPEEVTVLDLAKRIVSTASSISPIEFVGRPQDDPENRCPDITKANALLNWTPKVSLNESLASTVHWCRHAWVKGQPLNSLERSTPAL